MLRGVAIALVLGVPLLAHAGGLSTPEPDAAALGRAGTAVALPDGPSAVYYNPAGITLGRGLGIQVGASLADDRTRVHLAGAASASSRTVDLAPSLFITQRIGDHYGIGLGVYRAMAQSLEYPSTYAGRFHVQRADFGGTTIAPTVAARPASWLSVGFGIAVTFGQADVQQAQGDASYETLQRATTHSVSLGASVGLWARLYRQYLQLGFSYRSSTDLDGRGRITATPADSSTSLSVKDTRSTLPFPHQLAFALGSRPHAGTSLQFETRIALLHDLRGFTYHDTEQPPATLLSIPLHLSAGVQLRLGAEQLLLHDHLALRLGVGYDLGSARRNLDPAFPDGDRVIVSAGLGYHRSDVALDAGYLVSFSPGTAVYDSVRHIVGLTLSIRVGGVGPKLKRYND
ncbi:MAG: outer membrane protein transport protein [Polyangia bacterium]